ncbi:hypothetical protein Runsl_1158 [Runella slithyformis DSM 19594]|uniref:Uncharacterized protein n=1 Tax=Runella slithyformis (strain ATCC 29530 / DSM 19594 / LMG 11500 / NCIMB 11436 / LSU 4) TaxID=761193 RepID=A0A7U3ZI50_RUNSL|nr:hypothetical protein Runsl_1158 [Runella slithyformis DSM 19594]
MKNSFFNIDPDDKVSDSLKKALVSEIDTLRNTFEIVTLFVSHFFSTAQEVINPDKPKDESK